MDKNTISATGERAAIGGYIPQFNEFARLAYQELVNNNLEWIKIADPEAKKLDDIQYANRSEVHAYQVKWTIADQTISYLNFKTLLPVMLSSWKSLTAIHAIDKKIVIAHLLTNKALSKHDHIKSGNKEIGTFSDFYTEVWLKWKLGHPVNQKWNCVIEQLIADLRLSEADFRVFIDHFEFQPEHIGIDLRVSMRHSSEVDDLLLFRSFLLEKVADPLRKVPFTKQEIVEGLAFAERFKTTFNHELVIDINRYQSITSTVDNLNEKLSTNTGGYIFLVGGPGSGKSTLLTEWMRGRTERIFKYYAFDFTNPSFAVNYQERGDSTNLYFDLVFQLKSVGVYCKKVLPNKDLVFLKSAFLEQLNQLGREFEKQARKSVIVIDGLDHVPREYKSVKQSFLQDLPLPTDLPEGVFIVLGSQSYDLGDLSQEIKAEWKKGTRSVQMNPMGKKEVIKYAEASKITPQLTPDQQTLLVEKSQGHPLYLSYLVEQLKISEDRDRELNGFMKIDSDIHLYYNKIWEPIRNNAGLIEMLGLMARINDSISIDFVSEWNLPRQVLLDFKKDARVLFDEKQNEWTFFHNSFRLFLLSETAINTLRNTFDNGIDIVYHQRLAGLYRNSTVEPSWKQNYHLFSSGSYKEFIAETSSEDFFAQLIDFRPPDEIRRDIKFGIEIAQKTGNVHTLLRYLFSLAELERRVYNIDPALHIKKFLLLGRLPEAKRYARKGRELLISQEYALEVARIFDEFGDKTEGRLLFGLAQPDMIASDAIVVNYHKNIDNDTCQLLQEWVASAAVFQDYQIVLAKIRAFCAINLPEKRDPIIKPEWIKNTLLRDLAITLIDQEKWKEMETVIADFDLETDKGKNFFFYVLHYAVEANLGQNNERAGSYLKILLSHYNPLNTSDEKRVYMADLIMILDKDKDLVKKWIDGIRPPLIKNIDELGFEPDFDTFLPFIKFNKLKIAISQNIAPIAAIPATSYLVDNQIIVEYQRMLWLITQLHCEGISKQPITNLGQRIQPIIQFYNRKDTNHRTYWYRLNQIKTEYFDFLIRAVAASGSDNLKELLTVLLNDIRANSKHWSSEQVRGIADTLLREELEIEWACSLLSDLESTMLLNKDINARISECIQQANSYLLLDQKTQAEEWIKRGIREAIGVGYRKDYQYGRWLNWLTKNIKGRPDSAVHDISWFISHLHHLKKSTEGRAFDSAATKLLSITLDWNSAAGLEQMKWQLDNALIDFEDSVGSFVKHLMLNPISRIEYELLVDIYSELYLFIAVEPDINLLDSILERGDTLFGEEFYNTWIRKIHTIIISKSLDEKRPALLSAVEEFVRGKKKNILKIIPDFIIPEGPDHHRSETSSNTLVIRSGQSLPNSEVLARVNNYDEFRDLIKQEDKVNSQYNWSEVFKKINTSIGLHQISEIREIILNAKKSIDLLILLSEKALELGETAFAEKLANDAILHSNSSGWLAFYDGGSRIKSFAALQTVKGKESAKQAFDVFCYDLLNNDSAAVYIEALDDILPIITPGYKEDIVWEQLFAYLQRLMSTSIPSTSLPDLSLSPKNFYDNIIDFLIYFSKYDVNIVYAAAQKLLAKQLNSQIQYPLQVVASLKLENDADAEWFTGLMLLSQEYGNDLSFFYRKLENAAVSQNYMVRTEARYLLELYDQKVPEIAEHPLPQFYDLDLNSPNLETSILNIEGNIPPIDQIVKLMRPLGRYLQILSKLTGIKEKTLLYRIYMFMKEAGLPEVWLTEDEGDFSKHLEEIRLRYSYTKPRVLGVKRAIMKVVSELVDAQVLDKESAMTLFGPRDKGPDILPMDKRPTFVLPLGKKKLMLDTKDWLENIDKNPRLKQTILRDENGLNIIGEYTVLFSLDWDKAKQIFMSQIMRNPNPNEEWFIFGEVINRQTKDYHNLKVIGDSLIIVQKETHGNFTTLSNWIALNPVLARFLGWRPHSRKLFAWEDDQGNCLVESVYWGDGNVSMPPPRLYSEAGEGWYVLATDHALAQIRAIEPKLYLEKFIYRSLGNDESQFEQYTIVNELN